MKEKEEREGRKKRREREGERGERGKEKEEREERRKRREREGERGERGRKKGLKRERPGVQLLPQQAHTSNAFSLPNRSESLEYTSVLKIPTLQEISHRKLFTLNCQFLSHSHES